MYLDCAVCQVQTPIVSMTKSGPSEHIGNAGIIRIPTINHNILTSNTLIGPTFILSPFLHKPYLQLYADI